MNSKTLIPLILLILSASVILSCQKIEETDPPLGEQVSATAIQNEFRKVEQNVDPFGARKGDALALMLNVMVETPGNVQTLGLMQREVIEHNETPTAVEYKIRNIDYTVEDNTTTEVRNEICTMTLTNQITYSCPSWEEEEGEEPSLSAKAWTNSRSLLNKMLAQSHPAAKSEEAPIERRYYNLKTAQETITPPEAVRNRENCSGLDPCSIRLHYVQFDELERYKDGRTRRKRWDYALTSDLKYLGTEGIEYQTCLSESIDYEGRPVLLKQCLFVYDLIKIP